MWRFTDNVMWVMTDVWRSDSDKQNWYIFVKHECNVREQNTIMRYRWWNYRIILKSDYVIVCYVLYFNHRKKKQLLIHVVPSRCVRALIHLQLLRLKSNAMQLGKGNNSRLVIMKKSWLWLFPLLITW